MGHANEASGHLLNWRVSTQTSMTHSMNTIFMLLREAWTLMICGGWRITLVTYQNHVFVFLL